MPKSSFATLAALAALYVTSISRAGAAPQAAPDADIRFVLQWGRQGDKPGEFYFPIAIAINAADEIFITDHINNRIQKFDTNGKLLDHFPVLGNPGGIALDAAGNIYLTHIHASGRSKESAANRVSVYRPDGKLLRQWGQSGTGDGEFDCPGGLAIAKNGNVYVADQTNHRVQVFDSNGKFLFKWGSYGNEPAQFGGKSSKGSRTGGPQFVAFDADGNVWTTEGANYRIQKFTAEGKYLANWGTGDDKPGGFGGGFEGFENHTPTRLSGPIALCFDKHSRLWVSAVSGRVQQFSPTGQYLRGLTSKQGTDPAHFYAPHGIAFDSKAALYVVDSYNHRIQKFEVPR